MPRLLPNTCLEEWPIFLTHSIYFWKFLFGVCGSAASQTAGACLVLRGSRHAGPASAGPRPPSVRDFTAGVRARVGVWPCSHLYGLLATFFLQLEKECVFMSLERYLLKKSLIAEERIFKKPFRRFYFSNF